MAPATAGRILDRHVGDADFCDDPTADSGGLARSGFRRSRDLHLQAAGEDHALRLLQPLQRGPRGLRTLMALQKQILSVSLEKGLDTKTDSTSVVAGRFLRLENAVFTHPKSLRLRNGYQ